MFYLKSSISRNFNILQRISKRNFSRTDPMISLKDAYESFKSKKAVFLDVRDPKDHAASHIPEARNMNEIFSYLSKSDPSGIKELTSTFESLFQQAGINGNEHVITYEQSLNSRFGASCRGYYLLRLLGHKNVNVLEGGFDGWVKENYPTSSEPTKIEQPGNFKASFDDSIYLNREQVKDLIGKKDVVLIDVRDEEEWKAGSSSPYGKDFAPRKGRIPGAVHLMWKDLMKEKDGLVVMKDPEEIEQICKEKGITKDKQTVVYCFKGARSSNTYAALQHAGFKNLKNYFASWNEWSRDNNLPIDSKQL